MMENEQQRGDLAAAAAAIAEADAMVIGTGAGMGVDSGLGTFRGRNAGVWQPLKAMAIDFSEMSCPSVFEDDPYAAWAFWKYRHEAYTQSEPHRGYSLLAGLGSTRPRGCFSVTSNIDGHWARTAGIGEERTYEMHGALTHMQRIDGSGTIWPTDPAQITRLPTAQWDLAPGEVVEVLRHGQWETSPSFRVGDDGATIVSYDSQGVGGPLEEVRGVRRRGGVDLCRVSAGTPLPIDSDGHAARPNVLMFGDGGFRHDRIAEQEERYHRWLHSFQADKRAKLVVVEVGAGTAVPTIRFACEGLVRRHAGPATLVRLNLDQSLVPASKGDKTYIGIGGMGALESISKLESLVRQRLDAAEESVV